ncbi:MAG: arsenosugar biosynthesis radical SAM protein ArsS [Geobacteraceae bacterium]|nr:arsenosugar biosynthesis radical SAM protein ArsS [Geobacteraceae bacterium]
MAENHHVDFEAQILEINPAFARITGIETLQVNLGNLCNLCCTHCHQEASPLGTKIMGRDVIDAIADLLTGNRAMTLDITGGAPELHPDFRYFIELTEGNAKKRILRSNLAIMKETGMEWLPEFCALQRLSITASLPCYLEENVDTQRGTGTYDSSISAIKELNRLGYGSELELNLVYNPGGGFLPPSQQELETAYRQELLERHGITFTNLFTITNAPVGRFRSSLEKSGKLDRYMNLLAEKFNPCAAEAIMCRSLLSIDWQGHIYNCDFNQAVGRELRNPDGSPLTVLNLDLDSMRKREILFADYCYCCTAGEGSSCTGALT